MVDARCSPDEYLVARCEAVNGKGLRRTEADETARDLSGGAGLGELLELELVSAGCGIWGGSLAGRLAEAERSDGSEAEEVSKGAYGGGGEGGGGGGGGAEGLLRFPGERGSAAMVS
jgi:hypothetical protein